MEERLVERQECDPVPVGWSFTVTSTSLYLYYLVAPNNRVHCWRIEPVDFHPKLVLEVLS